MKSVKRQYNIPLRSVKSCVYETAGLLLLKYFAFCCSSHFRSDVTSRDFAKWRTSIKSNRMCPRTKLKVILKFSLNGELLCGAWLLKSFQHREGQRILSYSRNSVEIEAQKASLERQTSSDLARPYWKRRSCR